MNEYSTSVRSSICGIYRLLLLCSTLILGHANINFRECKQFFIGGSHIQPQVTGTYHLQKFTFNNRLLFRNTCGRLALYNNGSNWVIGPQEGSAILYVTAGTEVAPYPRDVTSWLSWHDGNGTWVEDNRLFIACTDNVNFCESLIIKGPDVPHAYRGPYDVADDYYDNQTYYKHRLDNLYLYNSNDSGCLRWTIGPVLGGDIVTMYSITESRSPLAINDLWTIVVSPSTVQQTYSVKVECTNSGSMSESCGVRLREHVAMPLLLSGRDAFPGKWPFMVSYRRADGVHKCGGALVERRWVVTAGHCVSRAKIANETIIIGAHNLDNTESSSQEFRIKSAHIHPEFVWVESPFRLDYDIALLELDRDVILTDHVQPVCIPPQREEFPFRQTAPAETRSSNITYTSCFITGWGVRDFQSDVGGILQELSVTSMLNIRVCYDVYYASLGMWMRDSRGVCLFGKDKGRMCKGDSGSPLFCKKAGRWTLLGLGGWSLSDCALYFFQYPSVYTDLAVFSDWITAMTFGQSH